MWPDVTIDVEVGPVRGIPVPASAVDQTVLFGDGYLCGWNLRESAGAVATDTHGSTTSPAAGAIFVTSPVLAAGTYRAIWTVELSGTVAAADADNFQISTGGIPQATSVNLGAAGEYPQPEAQVTVLQGNTVVIKAIAIGTVGAIYSATLSLIPVATVDALVEVQDGSNPLGEASIPSGGDDDRWFGPQGVRISQQIKLHMLQGAVAGVVYARFRK